MALLASLAAAVAVVLVIGGVFGSRAPGPVERLAGYGSAAARPVAQKLKTERRSLGEVVGGSPLVTAVNRIVERRTWSDEIARDLARADLSLRPAEFLAIRLLVVIGAIGVLVLLGATLAPALSSPIALISAALAALLLPGIYVGRRKQRRLRAFNSQLADTITLLANGLRAGSSFLQAVELVVRETQPPMSTEFNRVIREVNLGLALETALNNMVRRVRSDDLELMTTAIGIQYQVGGNLAEILDTIAFTIRERVRIKGEIRTLTAQQRLSGYVVGFLPVALLVTVGVIAPRFMSAMFERPPEIFGLPLGVIFLGFGAILMAIGFAFIRRIVDIEI